MAEENNMSFLQHLEELRWRLVKSAIAILVVAITLWFYVTWIMENIFLSMASPDFISFKLLDEYFGIKVDKMVMNMQTTEMASQFTYAILICIFGGLIISFPFVIYQLWSFVKPGLRVREKKMTRGITLFVSIMFFIGIAFGYFIVAPLCVQFFGSFRLQDSIELNPKIDNFMSLVLRSMFFSGILFLLPIIVLILSKIGLITPAYLRKYRKHAIVVVLILSAIITPPDFISQIIVSVPIIILYEISILISVREERKRRKAELKS